MVAINFAPGRRGNTYWFKRVGKKYQPQFATRAKLSRDPESGNFRLVRANGVSVFDSWFGTLIQTIGLNGVITEYITNPSTLQIQEIRTTSGAGAQTVVQSRLLEYFDDGHNWGQLRYVTQRRAVGVSNPTESDFTTLRRLELEYYQAFVQSSVFPLLHRQPRRRFPVRSEVRSLQQRIRLCLARAQSIQ